MLYSETSIYCCTDIISEIRRHRSFCMHCSPFVLLSASQRRCLVLRIPCLHRRADVYLTPIHKFQSMIQDDDYVRMVSQREFGTVVYENFHIKFGWKHVSEASLCCLFWGNQWNESFFQIATVLQQDFLGLCPRDFKLMYLNSIEMKTKDLGLGDRRTYNEIDILPLRGSRRILCPNVGWFCRWLVQESSRPEGFLHLVFRVCKAVCILVH